MAIIDQVFNQIERAIKDIMQHNAQNLKRWRRYTGAGIYKYALEMTDTTSNLLITIEKNSENVNWG